MSQFSYAQLEQLWINNGGPPSVAPIAAAVAEAESAGRSDATNPTDNNGTQTSWGLWQISDGTHNEPVANILDPNVNAQQAVSKWKAEGNSFSPAWGTYDSGAYKAFLSGSTTPDPNVPAGGSGTSSDGSGSGSTAAADSGKPCLIGPFPHTSFCILEKSQARALIGGGLILAGGGVMALGIILLFAVALGRGAGRAANVVALVPTPQAQAAARAMRSPRQAAAAQARTTARAQKKTTAAQARQARAKPKPAAKPKATAASPPP